MLGIAFAVLSAAGFGFNSASMRRGVLSASSSQGLYYTVVLSLPLFFLAALATGQLFEYSAFSGRDILVLSIAGVVHIMVGRYFNIRAISALGSNRAGPLVGTSTLVSVVVALIFLQEELSWFKAFGILLMMIGPALVVRSTSKSKKVSASEAPPVRPKEGYICAALAALAWGVGPVLMRSAMGDSGLGLLGGMTAYIAPSIILLLLLLLPGAFKRTMNVDPTAQKWFLVSTGNSFGANVFRFMALSMAPVTIVIPLVRTGVIFAIFFNLAINRTTESFDRLVILGILISVAGAVALVS